MCANHIMLYQMEFSKLPQILCSMLVSFFVFHSQNWSDRYTLSEDKENCNYCAADLFRSLLVSRYPKHLRLI